MAAELNDRMRLLVTNAAKKDGIINFTMEVEAGSTKGDNYMGTITKVKVSDVESNKSTNYILKASVENPEFRKIMPMAEAYDREAYFYSKVVDTYQALLKEYDQQPLDLFTKLMGYDLEIPEVLLMTDMKVAGYVMRDRKQYLDLIHVRLVMQAYGKFHGLYYALKTLKPEVCKELYNNLEDKFFNIIYNNLNDTVFEMQHEKTRKCLKEGNVLAMEAFERYAKDAKEKLLQQLKPTASGRFAVINHGDSWINNMLFRYKENDSENPTNICLLDFQLARIGSPAMDLSYFIFTCTSKQLRDTHFDEIMQVYHDSMRDLLGGFSLKVDDFLTIEELDQQMRLFSLYGVQMSAEVTHVMLSEVDEIPDFQRIDVETKVNKEDMITSFNYESKNNDLYAERMRGIFTDCAERGYL